jgi:hypothetical protein
LWEKETPRYRVAAGGGETSGSGGAPGVASTHEKLTVYLTVSGTVTARDPHGEKRRRGAAADTTTRGESR